MREHLVSNLKQHVHLSIAVALLALVFSIAAIAEWTIAVVLLLGIALSAAITISRLGIRLILGAVCLIAGAAALSWGLFVCWPWDPVPGAAVATERCRRLIVVGGLAKFCGFTLLGTAALDWAIPRLRRSWDTRGHDPHS